MFRRQAAVGVFLATVVLVYCAHVLTYASNDKQVQLAVSASLTQSSFQVPADLNGTAAVRLRRALEYRPVLPRHVLDRSIAIQGDRSRLKRAMAKLMSGWHAVELRILPQLCSKGMLT